MIGVFDPLWVVMMDDLDAPSWVGNAGVSIFGLPWILFATVGGTIAQKYGPFRISAFGLAIGACYMASYGFIGSPYVMLGVAVTQSALDALTVTGTGIAVAHAAPPQRQAGASGLLGGIQTLTGGIVALAAGSVYEHFGRGVAFGTTGVVMLSLVCVGCLLAGPKLLRRPLH
jgi:MFS family permease